ncbi:hypothetical protein B0H13DRAFT_977608 [Mycena leptocephala]|nr:hypothetical protein B0H13DRAFT_977608 [Mycena leptocephala]
MSPAGSVESAVGRAAFAFVCIVRRAGIRVACVREGAEAFASRRSGREGRAAQGRTSAGGGCETSGGAAGSRSFAPCGRIHTRTHLGGGQRLGRGRAARWIMAAAACIIGRHWRRYKYRAGAGRARQTLAAYRERAAAGCAGWFGTFTSGVKAAGASALRCEFAFAAIFIMGRRMGKQCGSGAKAAADCALIHMAREPARRGRITWAQARARETGSTAAGRG